MAVVRPLVAGLVVNSSTIACDIPLYYDDDDDYYYQAADARAAHPLPRMLDELLGAQLDAAVGTAPPMDESRRRAAAHGAALVRPKPYDVWV